jgi:1,4-alpha-glucan branching enzyme
MKPRSRIRPAAGPPGATALESDADDANETQQGGAVTLRDREKLPSPGAVERDGHVTFTLYAPGKRSVHLIGDFNDWDRRADPMAQVDDGLWSTEKELPRGAFGYQFLVDGANADSPEGGELVICDPYARYVEQEPGDRPRKAIVKPRQDPYRWRHDDWDRPAFEDLLIYELHIADFTPQRDFREAVEHLGYVSDLGMNAIELMPVFGIYENKGWGYTPTFLFAPNEDYGTPDELRWFIDEAHGRGMAVILDMVLAHTGHEHPFNRMYPYDQSPWYGPSPGGGNAFGLPQLDYSKEPTRDFARDVLEYWVRDYHVDGFRFDYVNGIGVTEDGHGVPTLSWAARQARPDAYVIGENLPENPPLMLQANMDGAWHVRFSYAIKALLCQCPIESYDPRDFERCLRVLDPAAEGYGERPTCMVNYLESHDEERIVLEVTQAGFDESTARCKSALGATVLMTAVGEPMLYHGQTLGQDTPKNMDHNYIDWEDLGTPGGSGLHEHYKRLTWLRRRRGSLRTGHIAIDAVWPDRQSVVYHRWNDVGDVVVVVANFSDGDQRLPVPMPLHGRWRELFSDREAEMGGTVEVDVGRCAAKVFLTA